MYLFATFLGHFPAPTLSAQFAGLQVRENELHKNRKKHYRKLIFSRV